MSNLPGNPFAEDHDFMYHSIGDTVVSEIGQTDATLIWSAIENHATATLALAYEQRTANLITLAQFEREPISPDYDMETIYNRLGLGENNA